MAFLGVSLLPGKLQNILNDSVFGDAYWVTK